MVAIREHVLQPSSQQRRFHSMRSGINDGRVSDLLTLLVRLSVVTVILIAVLLKRTYSVISLVSAVIERILEIP
jgi:hypothetical protein